MHIMFFNCINGFGLEGKTLISIPHMWFIPGSACCRKTRHDGRAGRSNDMTWKSNPIGNGLITDDEDKEPT